MKTIRITVVTVLALSSTQMLQAQLTWDPVLDADRISNGCSNASVLKESVLPCYGAWETIETSFPLEYPLPDQRFYATETE